MSTSPQDPTSYQNIFHWAETQKDGTIPSFRVRKNDPYTYLSGFNNTHESEAVPGTIPQGQNSPRNVRFGLYAEQMTASAFVAPRHLNKKAWLYRARPAVAHRGFVSAPMYEFRVYVLLIDGDRRICLRIRIRSLISCLSIRECMCRLRSWPGRLLIFLPRRKWIL
jgi:hypothetical protein